MRARSTFWLRARCSSRSSGPSKPATSTTSDGSPVSARHRRSRPTDGPSVRLRGLACPMLPPPRACASAMPPLRNRSRTRRAVPPRPPRRGCRYRPSARSARSSDLPYKPVGARRDARHLLHHAVAVKDQIAARRKDCRRLCREIPRKRLHRGVVAHQQAVEADLAADDLLDHLAPTWSPDCPGRSAL